MPSAEAQANALITLLENLQPRWALTPHLSRLEAIVVELKGSQPEDDPHLVTTKPLLTKPVLLPVANNHRNNSPLPPCPSPLPPPLPLNKEKENQLASASPTPTLTATTTTTTTTTTINAAQKVWNDQSLLSRILDFDGSLGYYYRNYDLFVGYERPTPYNQTKYLPYRAGTRGIHLVNKACHRLTLGKEGLQHLQVSYKSKLEKQVAIAKETKNDVTVSWLARVYAMAMADDALALESIIRMYTDPTQPAGGGGGPFGAALDLYYDEEYFELRLPPGHKFEGCAITDLVEFRLEYDGDNRQEALIAELAYNAMRVGAMRTLEILKRHFGWGLYYLEFDDKRGGDFLSTFVQYVCAQPYHTTHAQCVRALLRGEAIGLESHERVAGSVGNLLHLAAAKGDYELVSALLDCGFDPSIKCEQGNCFFNRSDERQEGKKEFPLPEDWARVRGHHQVATLLQQRREKLRPLLRQRFQNRPFYVGKLTRFFAEQNRMYGFITPDHGQAGLNDGGNGVFVHISNLQRGARNDGHSNLGYPTPGQRLAFSVRKDRRGRQRADVVISGDDFSYVNLLQMTPAEAEHWWAKYHRDGTDDEDSDEETDNDSYAAQDGDGHRPEVPTLINIPLGVEDGYFT